MKTGDATRVLRTLGWSIHRDETGDKGATYALPDRIVRIVYGIRPLPQTAQFEAVFSLSTPAFSAACLTIDPEGSAYAPLVAASKGYRDRAPDIVEHHIRQASDAVLAWAEAQDLDQALRARADLPSSAPGAAPIWHLAALALRGDLDRLNRYQASFEAGDRLGFVPYITRDHIDRAVLLARRSERTPEQALRGAGRAGPGGLCAALSRLRTALGQRAKVRRPGRDT